MKKFFAILMTICLMVSALNVTAITASAAGTVLRVTAIKGEGTVLVGDFDNFEDGWNKAMEIAGDEDEMDENDYDRIVVDFHADWKGNAAGKFCDRDSDGFDNNTIYIPDEAKVTLNLNGHTIDRNLAPWLLLDGEVMYIDEGADVIINDGTITGGFSENGAGGIHINDEAKVTLNNVHIVGNISDDDDGGGIALYDNATLVMNGGSFQNNILRGPTLECYGGAIYIEDSTATFNSVTFKNNTVEDDNEYGAAIYADESTVTINECIFDGNGTKDDAKELFAAISIVHAVDSSITVKKSSFTNNGDLHYVDHGHGNYDDVSTLIYLDDSSLVMEGCGVSQNTLGYLIHTTDNSEFFVSGTNMTYNTAIVLNSEGHSADSFFNGCTFGNNISSSYTGKKYPFLKYTFKLTSPVTFYNCDMGNSTYSNPANVKRINHNLDSGVILSLSTLEADGTIVKIEDYRSFEEGWNAAMEAAKANTSERVIVDIYADWNASDGKFTDDFFNGAGFDWNTIYIPEGVKVTLNMNGHTINRGLGNNNEYDGEVIFVSSNADLIINGGKDGDPFVKPSENPNNVPMGAISGGNSDNGAGGIHMQDGARVTLNNVNIIGNAVDDEDGAGIAAYNGAILTMNGGSISGNTLWCSFKTLAWSCGGIYLNNAGAYLNGVEFADNIFRGYERAYGVAIYAENSHIVAENCTFKHNGYANANNSIWTPQSVIEVKNSSLDITSCLFEDNGTANYLYGPDMIVMKESTVRISNSIFRNNSSERAIVCRSGILEVTDTVFEGTTGNVFNGSADEGSFFTDCTFANNSDEDYWTFAFGEENHLEFKNCEFDNDTTFNDRSRATFDGKVGAGSIFGAGSLTNILVIMSLIASGVCIFLTVYYNKKKAVPVTANGADEPDDEE